MLQIQNCRISSLVSIEKARHLHLSSQKKIKDFCAEDLGRSAKVLSSWLLKAGNHPPTTTTENGVRTGVISLMVPIKGSKCAFYMDNRIIAFNNLVSNGHHNAGYDELGKRAASFRAAMDFFFVHM